MMKTIGFNQPLCMLPFDHRGSFVTKLFGWQGENNRKVHDWLTTAVGVKGFTGFSVGRADSWEPLVNFRAKQITRETAVLEIARRFHVLTNIFEKALSPRQNYATPNHVAAGYDQSRSRFCFSDALATWHDKWAKWKPTLRN